MGIRRMLIGTAALGVGTAAVYIGVVRPRLLWWGSEIEERTMPLPGDELVDNPHYQCTRAITIAAAPDCVWPWLVQMGQGRGGLYSYDWLENLVGCDIHSADEVVPQWQHLQPGDEVRLYPKQPEGGPDLAYIVNSVDPQRSLVLITPGSEESALGHGLSYGSWAFVLQPVAADRTRLVVRSRATHPHTLISEVANHYALEFAHAVMERKMLLGISGRAEAWAAATGWRPGGTCGSPAG